MNQAEKITLTCLAALTAAAITVQGAGRSPLRGDLTGRRIPGHPRAKPRSAVPLSVGDTVSIGGQSYTVGYGLIPATTPVPPPTPKLIAFTTNGPTFSAQGLVTGTLTLDSPAPVGGMPVSLISSAPSLLPLPASVSVAAGAPGVSFTAPVGSPAAATSVILTAAAGGATLTATVTVLGSGGVPLQIHEYRDGNRNQSNNFGPGQTVYIDGVGFGTTPGKVTINNNVIPTLKWTDTELSIVCPPVPTGANAIPCLLDVRRADGQDYHTTQGFVIIPPPVRPAGG